MKVKYKNILTWKIMAIVWFLLTGFAYFRWVKNPPENLVVERVFLLLGLTLLIGIYYLSMPKISYCTLKDQKISIHQSSVIIRRTIKLEQLDCCRVSKRDLEFYLKNGRSFAIHLDWCQRDQAIELIKALQSSVMVYDGNTQRSIKLNNIEVFS